MDERDLEPEEAGVGLLVDKLCARGGGVAERRPDVVYRKGNVVHARPAARNEPADRRVLAERPQELDTVGSDPQRDGLDPLLRHRRVVLNDPAEEPLVEVDGGRDVVDSVPDMMDVTGAHCAPILGDGYPQGAPMGFLDKIKQQATDVASTVAEKTQETAKTGQLQMQLRSLKGEEKEAFADFGRQAYGLHRDGALAERSGELASGAARIADLQSQIAAKEQEVADMKGDEGSETVEGSAEEVADPAAEAATPPPAADAPPPPPPPPTAE